MADTAPDGSPVALYALLPERGEGDLVASVASPGATVLELGCGAGRITRQLVARGFRVTAVDESPEMLAHVQGAETFHAPIEKLDLGRRFDVALLASNLVNTAEPTRRRAFLETCVRHASLVVIETLPLGWQPVDGAVSEAGEVEMRLQVDGVDGPIVRGTMRYAGRGRRWEHAFRMMVFADESELDAALADVGLRVDRWLDRTRGWFTATAETDA